MFVSVMEKSFFQTHFQIYIASKSCKSILK